MSTSPEDTSRRGVAAATAPEDIVNELLDRLVVLGGRPEELELLKAFSQVCQGWRGPAMERIRKCLARRQALSEVMGLVVTHGGLDSDSLLAASLTCREWTSPAQGRLLRTLGIISGTQAKRAIIELAGGAAELVKTLVVGSMPQSQGRALYTEPSSHEIAAVDGISRTRLLRLLAIFPKITTLILIEPAFAQFHPNDTRMISHIPFLPHLTSLCVLTGLWGSVKMVRDIIALTPELTKLELREDSERKKIVRNRQAPVDLPRLESLDLEGVWATSFADLGLLSAATLSHVKELYWCDECLTVPRGHVLVILGGDAEVLHHYHDDGDDHALVESAARIASACAAKNIRIIDKGQIFQRLMDEVDWDSASARYEFIRIMNGYRRN
ncbi:hypothetical protein RQP46_006103 [Phenoliferia psychrophenolica]